MDDIDTPAWADNPRLNAWLATQQAAFPQWAADHGGGWDFSPESLGRLEKLIRSRFTTWEEADQARDTVLMSVATWYLGEVQVRHCGASWRCVPDEPDEPPVAGGYPLVTIAREHLTDTERDLLDADDAEDDDDLPSVPLIDPAAKIRSLCANPHRHLTDVLDWYARFTAWRRSVAG
ncbi:hypothetical protein J7I98_34370 [Streptomyces sp. ISL-98]|uniref:hypothetical protein n=1 Tax=Streptomyces sp. ISL-98 TaxID=2819192 RepID=UPI001BE836C6|nr:hypothetical protein [Streptomyces sp. ISL-98]MBT2510817.1 hypothetical protein [Streptomyces sp. ISL-98]